MTDELERLSKLHKDGTLNDAEFAQAKSKLLSQPAEGVPAGRDDSRGAAERDVTFWRFLGVLGFILLLLLVFGVFLPHLHYHRWWPWHWR